MSRWVFGAALLTVALSSVACAGEPPSAETVRWHIERQLPGVRFHRDTHLRLGRFTMALARGVVRLVEPGDRETHRILSHVRRVDVATYEVEGVPALDGLRLPPRLEKDLASGGWVPMVRTREEDSRTWIYYRENGSGSIRNLYIVELDSDEMTIIDLAGSLDRMAAELVADDPNGFVAGLGP
jgi:Domain of unknown function (DUF4252)